MMQINENMTTLARQIWERRGKVPTILLLGSRVAQAAGLPGAEEMVSQYLGKETHRQSMQGEESWQYLLDAVDKRSSASLYAVLQRVYSSLPIPKLYQDLAPLVRGGYFGYICTISPDTLLEEALEEVGLHLGVDYTVLTPGLDIESPAAWSEAEWVACIVKLLDQLIRRSGMIDPEELGRLLGLQRFRRGRQFLGEVVTVGYDLESEVVNRWLGSMSGRLWWVSPDRPRGRAIDDIARCWQVAYIDGPSADPSDFFGVLGLLVSQADRQKGVETSDGLRGQPKGGPDEERSLEVQYLQEQLRAGQRKLLFYEQQIALTLDPVEQERIRRQAAYQREQNAALESRLRQVAPLQLQAVDLMQSIASAARQGSADPGVLAYLNKQVDVVRREMGRPQPNKDLIEAAISATVLLAERLDSVDQEAVRRLASLAPGASPRGL